MDKVDTKCDHIFNRHAGEKIKASCSKCGLKIYYTVDDPKKPTLETDELYRCFGCHKIDNLCSCDY